MKTTMMKTVWKEARYFPHRVWQGLSDAWKYGKVALLIATLFLAACVIATWSALS